MAAKLGGDNEEPISEINIVPFVDIILVVLIIFMITTPFIVKPGINVNLPKAASGEETLPSQINLTLTAKGELMMNGKPADEAGVGSFAKQAAVEKPETQAIIAADRDVPHGRVVEIIDLIKTSGITRFAITIDNSK